MRKKIITFTTLLMAGNAFAYIDPGTGVAVLGSLGPVIIAVFSAIGAFLVKIFWNPIKNTFLKLKKLKIFRK